MNILIKTHSQNIKALTPIYTLWNNKTTQGHGYYGLDALGLSSNTKSNKTSNKNRRDGGFYPLFGNRQSELLFHVSDQIGKASLSRQ
jgi:hypothetical protein